MLVALVACVLVAQPDQHDSVPRFSSETKMVLVSFNVARGTYFAPDVKRDEVVLLQDGKPRDFSVFEGPASGHRPPLELVLLFDTTTLPPPESKIVVKFSHWDRERTYAFTSSWGDRESRSILEKAGADVRVSVYRYDRDRIERLCGSTKDSLTLSNAIHKLPEPMQAEAAVGITMPKGRSTLKDIIEKRTGPMSPKIQQWPISWTYEAVIDTLKESGARPDGAMRALIVFSEMDGPTTTKPGDAADHANSLGVPVYPVVLDYDEYVQHPFTQGEARGAGAIPMERPNWAPPYDPNAPSQSLAGIRDWGSKDTIGMMRLASLGPLTGAEALFPTRLGPGVVESILKVIRDKSLSQYVVGFMPSSSGQQKNHSLEIKLKSKSAGSVRGGKRTAVY